MSLRVARRSIYSPSGSATLDSKGGTVTMCALAIGVGLGISALASFLTPLVLGMVTQARQKLLKNDEDGELQSTLLTGRVWHTRFHPVKHSFSYPLFMFGIDLDDEVTFNRILWPLSWIMKFSVTDHLINGEGRDEILTHQSLQDRVFSLVHQRTAGYLRPNSDSHRVVLVTHLAYYGYCFNPVSFYYLLRRSTGRMEAIVAEVSNTPWIEQYSYCLHPTSRAEQVRYTRCDEEITNYKFPKKFHVSPFMEMEYTYDWTFAGQDQVFGQGADVDKALRVTTSMLRPADKKTQFTATMKVRRAGIDPMILAWQLAWYPSYCFIIQFWIHYEAFWLFWKGVAYCPHPDGSETTASRIIGAVMTPFFELQTWLAPKQGQV